MSHDILFYLALVLTLWGFQLLWKNDRVRGWVCFAGVAAIFCVANAIIAIAHWTSSSRRFRESERRC